MNYIIVRRGTQWPPGGLFYAGCLRGFLICVLLLAGCQSPPPKVTERDPVQEPAYRQASTEFRALSRAAQNAFLQHKPDLASHLIQESEPLAKRLLGVPHLPLEVAEAASDLDGLYGRMLLSNHHYGWARLQFQKNLARWKNWTPQTDESAKRLQQAKDAIAECDRYMEN